MDTHMHTHTHSLAVVAPTTPSDLCYILHMQHVAELTLQAIAHIPGAILIYVTV